MKIDKKNVDKIKALVIAKLKKIPDSSSISSGFLKKFNKRILVKLSALLLIAVTGLGAMKFVFPGKPVIVAAKVSQTSKAKKVSSKSTNSGKDQEKGKGVDTKIIDVNDTQAEVDSIVNELDKKEDPNSAKDELNVVIGSNSVQKVINIAETIVGSVNQDTYPLQADVNTTEMDSNDIKFTDSPVTLIQDKTQVSEIQSLVFMKNMEIQDALHFLAAKYRKNIVPTPEVKGQLAFENLYEVTFEEAMDAILGTDFRYEQKGNLVKVYPSDKGQMIHKVFVLYYINAEEARKLVSQVLSQDGKIEVTTAAQTGVPVDETISNLGGGDSTAMHDTLIICDYPENLQKAEQVLASIDVRPEQVMIEATILSATLTEGMQFGIDWQTLKSVVIQELADITQDTQDYLKSTGTSARVGSSSLTGGLTIGFVHDDVAGFLRAVEEVTDVTVLANPKILAVNKQLGQIYIGKKIAYQSQTTQTDTSTTEQVQFLETGTKLSFRPYIGNDGYIRIDIHPKDSSATLRSSGTSTLPDETSAELVTNIIVKDGQTIVIGGLFRESISTARTQVPLLGDIPIIGGFFRGVADEISREEVIVLLTPHIVSEPNQIDGSLKADDIERKLIGARNELQWVNKVRRANEHYDTAAELYLQGDYQTAIKELDAALKLYPAYLEAIHLKELIMRELSLKRLKSTKNR